MARTSRAVAKTFVVPAPTIDAAGFRQRIIDIINAEAVDVVVPISEETMHVVGFQDALPTNCEVYTSDAALVRALHSKRRFIETAADHGLRVPQTFSGNTNEARALMAQSAFVVKPEYSCSGRGVMRYAPGDVQALSNDMVVQQAIDGDEYSAFAIAHEGNVLAQVTYKAVIRHGSVAVVFERCEQPSVDTWLKNLVGAVNYTGFIAIDAILDQTGVVYAIECNPRATSGIHFIETHDLAAAIIDRDASVRMRPERRLQEFWSAWTHWFSSLGNRQERRKTMDAIRSAKDVTWRRSDPWVFLLATFSTWPIISKAIRHRTDFASVLALDIEWVGDDET